MRKHHIKTLSARCQRRRKLPGQRQISERLKKDSKTDETKKRHICLFKSRTCLHMQHREEAAINARAYLIPALAKDREAFKGLRALPLPLCRFWSPRGPSFPVPLSRGLFDVPDSGRSCHQRCHRSPSSSARSWWRPLWSRPRTGCSAPRR